MPVRTVGCVGVHLGVCALQHMVPLGAAQSRGGLCYCRGL